MLEISGEPEGIFVLGNRSKQRAGGNFHILSRGPSIYYIQRKKWIDNISNIEMVLCLKLMFETCCLKGEGVDSR